MRVPSRSASFQKWDWVGETEGGPPTPERGSASPGTWANAQSFPGLACCGAHGAPTLSCAATYVQYRLMWLYSSGHTEARNNTPPTRCVVVHGCFGDTHIQFMSTTMVVLHRQCSVPGSCGGGGLPGARGGTGGCAVKSGFIFPILPPDSVRWRTISCRLASLAASCTMLSKRVRST
jgi:hypothetical protein